MSFPKLLALVTLLALAPSPVAAQDAAAIVARAARTYGALTSLQADFSQRIADSLIGNFESEGRLVQAGQNQLSMRFSDPAGDAIIVDGTQVWVYTPSTAPGQVIRMPLRSGPTYGFNVLSWILDRPAERYRMRYLRSDTVAGTAVDVIELVPLSADLPFSRAEVAIARSDALPRRLIIAERRGGTRTITLRNLVTNSRLGAGTFAFVPPRGVRVVDQR